MALKPMALNTPEAIAAAYDGNKKKIADAARMGLIDPTAAVMAGMFIDRMRSAAIAEQRPTTTVADDVLGAAQMPAGVAAIPQQPQQAPGAGVAALPSGIKEMAGGGIVAFDEGGAVPGYAGGGNPDSRYDPAMRIDPRVQRQRDEGRLQILLQELKEEEAKGNKANVEMLRREIRAIKPAPSADGGVYSLFPSAAAATTQPAPQQPTTETSSPLGRGVKNLFGIGLDAPQRAEAYKSGLAAYDARIKQVTDELGDLGGIMGLRQQTPEQQSRYEQLKREYGTLVNARNTLGQDILKYNQPQQATTTPAGANEGPQSIPYPLGTLPNEQRPSIPYPGGASPSVTPTDSSISDTAPALPEAPTPVYGATLPALAKLEPELIKAERLPTPEETMAKKKAARQAAGVDEDFAAKRKEAIAKEREDSKGEFEKDKWLAFAQMSAEIAAGTSPNALTNIATGLAKGMPGFAQLRKDMKEKEKLLREREDKIDDLEQARRSGDADAIYNAEEKVVDLNRSITLHNNKVTNAAKEAFWKGTNDFAALAFQQYKLDERQKNELRQRAWELNATTQAQWDRLAADIAARKDIAKERTAAMASHYEQTAQLKRAEFRQGVLDSMGPMLEKKAREAAGGNAPQSKVDKIKAELLEAEVNKLMNGFLSKQTGTDAYSGWNLLPD